MEIFEIGTEINEKIEVFNHFSHSHINFTHIKSI